MAEKMATAKQTYPTALESWSLCIVSFPWPMSSLTLSSDSDFEMKVNETRQSAILTFSHDRNVRSFAAHRKDEEK